MPLPSCSSNRWTSLGYGLEAVAHSLFPMKTKNQNQIQQGDVLLRVVTVLPQGCKRLSHKILAHGESGNWHAFTPSSNVALMEAPDKTVFAVNEGDAPETLVHQEHKKVILQPGQVAEFGQVREYDWFSFMTRTVVD